MWKLRRFGRKLGKGGGDRFISISKLCLEICQNLFTVAAICLKTNT